MVRPIIDPNGLAERLDAAFLEPSPNIQSLYAFDHAKLGGEQMFFCFACLKSGCLDATTFFGRAVALTWEDATVGEDGAPFPGLRQLTTADLATPGYREQREDMLRGGPTASTTEDAVKLDALCERLGGRVDLAPLGPARRVQALVSEWNLVRLLWETTTHWAFAEWSTSA